MEEKTLISGLATGIGSLPYKEPEEACNLIFAAIPEIPFWPQLVKRGWNENMIFQYSDGMPALVHDPKNDKLIINPDEDKENALALMYEKFLGDDIDHFRIPEEKAKGLYYLLNELGGKDLERSHMLKGHVTGPFTFAFSSVDNFGKSLLYDEPMLEAIAKVIAMKAVWQAEKLKKFNKPVMIFFDEPYLSSFGSAFCPLSRERVISLLNEIFNIIRQKTSALIGVHCCGNTDWSIFFESGADIVNFDAWEYTEKFLLYPGDIKKFISDGGFIAWGIVPTNAKDIKITLKDLEKKFQQSIQDLSKAGIDREMLFRKAIFTPSCGLGTKTKADAEYVFKLLKDTKGLIEKVSRL